MFRRYDQAVLDFLRASVDGREVPIFFATARREYGSHEETETEVEARGTRVEKTVPLPSMTVTRLGWDPAPEREILVKHRKLAWSKDLNHVVQAQHPNAYNVGYQLDVWTKLRSDANFLIETSLTRFPRRLARLAVDLGFPWGTKGVYLRRGAVVDNTDLEPGADADREVRMTLDMTLEAWLVLPATDVRTVRQGIVDVDVEWIEPGRGLDARVYSVTFDDYDMAEETT